MKIKITNCVDPNSGFEFTHHDVSAMESPVTPFSQTLVKRPAEADVLRIITETVIASLIERMEDENHESFAWTDPYQCGDDTRIRFYSGYVDLAPVAKAVLDALKTGGVL